jgi:hypothetical protein
MKEMKAMYEIKQWKQLSNGYWLKMVFTLGHDTRPTWYVSMVVGKTRRLVNDTYSKSGKSPKNLVSKSTNHHAAGIEALMTAFRIVQDFEKALPEGSEIQVHATDMQRARVYGRLQRYGYIQKLTDRPKSGRHGRPYYVKVIGAE